MLATQKNRGSPKKAVAETSQTKIHGYIYIIYIYIIYIYLYKIICIYIYIILGSYCNLSTRQITEQIYYQILKNKN